MSEITTYEMSTSILQDGMAGSLTSPEFASRRIPWIAFSLSLLSAGVGHVYSGRIAKALPLYFAWLAVPLCCVVASTLQPSWFGLTLLLAPVAIVMVAYVYAAVDAWRTATEVSTNYSLRDFNRPSIYLLLVGVQMSFSIGLVAVAGNSVYEAFLIPSKSMSPTILAGDRVLANKMLPEDHVSNRGDLVVYLNPTAEGATRFLGRVVAIAGDSVEISDNNLLINGEALNREKVSSDSLELQGVEVDEAVFYEENEGARYMVAYSDSKAEKFETTVPDRHVFIMGDNRNRSRDSRHFGAIHTGDVVGSVDYIYWPAGSLGRFGVIAEE